LTNIDNDFSNTHSIGHTEIIIAELHADNFVCHQWGDTEL
jgi:hypothetical protein